MRAVVQRVMSARVRVDERVVGEIGRGLLVFVGVEKDDGPEDVKYIAGKIEVMRIFEDAFHKMNRAVTDVDGQVLVVSQFTLAGDCRRGRRPSFDAAERPDIAKPIYEALVEELRSLKLIVEIGEFQADMQVELVNDGPVTILLDSRRRW